MDRENYAVQQLTELIGRLKMNGLLHCGRGSVSMRLDEDLFAIALIEDYKADVKVFSPADVAHGDARMHLYCYEADGDACYIVHTHQLYASVVSILDENELGIPCVDTNVPWRRSAYGRLGVSLRDSTDHCCLLKRHGAMISGANEHDVLKTALALEERCKSLFLGRVNISIVDNDYDDAGKYTGEVSDVFCGDYRVVHASTMHGNLHAWNEDFASFFGNTVFCTEETTYIVPIIAQEGCVIIRSTGAVIRGRQAFTMRDALVKNCAALIFAHGVRTGTTYTGIRAYLIKRMYMKKTGGKK